MTVQKIKELTEECNDRLDVMLISMHNNSQPVTSCVWMSMSVKVKSSRRWALRSELREDEGGK